eukprot:Amastigsp_a176678_22.p3 type:complete len:156 gc:universal Amastigsp_a176678_22:1095-628(-)
MAEKVAEELKARLLKAPEVLVEIARDGRVARRDVSEGTDGRDDGVENARHLGVLVDKDEGGGHIVVAEMHRRGADPAAADLAHGARENVGHRLRDSRRRLLAVEPLAGVAEPVLVARIEEILLGEMPQFEELELDLAPEDKALEHIVVLRDVVVR